MMIPTLIHLPYSPWSERARWALDARKVRHARRLYQPLLGEPELRVRLRRARGAVSVPVLLTEDGPLSDSWEIARFADAHATDGGKTLFPASQLEEIRRWNDRSEAAVRAGRGLSLARVVTHEAALLELVPRALRKPKSVAVAISRFGVQRTRAKYGADDDGAASHEAVLVSVLDELREALGPSAAAAPRTLLGEFSYADITMTQVLAFVRPADARFFRIGRATRECFGDEKLASRYEDVLSWRDAIYERYRDQA